MTSAPRETGPIGQIALAAWLVLCFATYVFQAYSDLPLWLHTLLTAAYKE